MGHRMATFVEVGPGRQVRASVAGGTIQNPGIPFLCTSSSDVVAAIKRSPAGWSSYPRQRLEISRGVW